MLAISFFGETNDTLHSTTREDSSAWESEINIAQTSPNRGLFSLEAMDSWLGFATVGCLENVPNTCSPKCWLFDGDLQCYNMKRHVKQIPK